MQSTKPISLQIGLSIIQVLTHEFQSHILAPLHELVIHLQAKQYFAVFPSSVARHVRILLAHLSASSIDWQSRAILGALLQQNGLQNPSEVSDAKLILVLTQHGL